MATSHEIDFGGDTQGQAQHHNPYSSIIPPSPSSPALKCPPDTRVVHNSTTALQKDKDVYCDDGNVLLVAGTTCFRVHQSLLAKHSSVFHDMFNIPQPNSQETFEGVPKVDLQDDPAVVRALLRVIYEPFTSPLKTWLTQPTAKSVAEMVGVMSLALKYEIDALRNEIVQQLSSAWPRSIEDWDLLEKKHEMFSDTPRLDPAAAIRMARIADLPEILPLAYYCTIQAFPKPLMNAVGGGDETSGEDNTSIKEGHAMTHLLDRRDLAALALGREEMGKWVAQYARVKFRTWNCHSSMNQRGFVCSQRIHLRWAEVLEDVTMRRDVLEILREHAGWGTGTFGSILCSPCQSAYVEIMREMRRDFFQALPKIFGL
ncbi:hypothetical protein P691DRAFT_776773 [Macrolepiota fuliginosa MF-IS2]|uniref:BTB domain-containing protein n=1 Tax=Macrolepiota fuliginosa MF-IS2 TaxID=1400762 RepID=A0A9P5XC24_9AGAR|nr:hypothetical protein P691DRAFT_776773 [Macrolepiota fuliginosa MF-IS2]